MLDGVIEGATGASLNALYTSALAQPIGMNGGYIRSGFNNVLFSTPRSMARFGLLALNDFVWDGKTVLGDNDYVEAMTNTSQDLNLSYGYLWWLNGKESFMLPGLQLVIRNPLTPTAPPDAYYGLGKNDQILCVVPSEKVVVIRMGDAASPDGPAVPTQFASELWALLRDVICTPTSVATTQEPSRVEVGPYSVFDLHGRLVATGRGAVQAQHLEVPSGIYVVRNELTGTVQKLFVP